MKRIAKVLCGAAVLLLLFWLGFGDPVLLYNEKTLQNAVVRTTEETVLLSDLTGFDWDAVYTFSPYTSRRQIEQVIGFSSSAIEETVSEGMIQLLFVRKKRVVCSVCGYPSSLGYGIAGMPQGEAVLNQDDAPRFQVERRGETVWLEYMR